VDTQLPLPRIITADSEVLPVNWSAFFKKHRIWLRIVLMYENEAENGKVWPALEILLRGIARGDHKGSDTIIDSTSGNYAVALAVILRLCLERNPSFPIKYIVAVVSRSLPQGKRERLLKYGIRLIDADDAVDAMHVAERTAKEFGYWYTRQYWNEDNCNGYRRVAESIAERVPELGMAVWGVGSGGGCAGVMAVLQQYFEGRNMGFERVAVVVEDGQKVGGVRDEAALEPGSLEWRAPNIDDVRFVGEDASYFFSSALWRSSDASPEEACLGGPSTGFVCEGAALAARRLIIMRKFDQLRASDGYVHVVVPSMDKRTPYRSEYEQKGIYLPKSQWE
jgi:cysteine synthase